MGHRIQCRCGAGQGALGSNAAFNHAPCYCDDCQAFAHFLGCANEVLDAGGGTRIVQILQSQMPFERHTEHLACMRLSPPGMLPW